MRRKGLLSLKVKTGVYVGCFSIFFIIGLMMAVGLGLDRYYYSMKKEAMIEASQKISATYQKKNGPDEHSLDSLSQRYGVDILIVDNNKLVYSSRSGRRVHLPPETVPEDQEIIALGKENEVPADRPEGKPPVHIKELLDGKAPMKACWELFIFIRICLILSILTSSTAFRMVRTSSSTSPSHPCRKISILSSISSSSAASSG